MAEIPNIDIQYIIMKGEVVCAPIFITRVTVGMTVHCRLLTLGRFLVRLNVKVDEQAEVAGEKTTPKESSRFSASTIRPMRKVIIVSSCVVLVGCGLV